MKKNVVAIIGRPNTGKSTLFNKILGKREVIVNKMSGTTRDIISKDTQWGGINFQLSDTGGLNNNIKTNLEKNIQLQTQIILKKANVIVFLVNTKEGITSQDITIAKKLKKSKKNVILAANKADNEVFREKSFEFYKLGLGKPFPVSAIVGSGVGDLLDKTVSLLKKDKKEAKLNTEIIKVSILGKPNVGKSSLFNALPTESKVIVSEIPGTTIDTVDTSLSYKGKEIIITDTAGLRKKSKIKLGVEKTSFRKSIGKIKNSDICLLLLDAKEKISHQDIRIASKIIENNKGIILVVNKWDQIESGFVREKKGEVENYTKYLQSYFPFLYWAPLVFISAKYKKNINDILNFILEVEKERKKNIPQEKLQEFIKIVSQKFFQKKENIPLIYHITQPDTFYPVFNIYTKNKGEIPYSFIKFIEKKLREKFGFLGTPIEINLVKN